MSDQVEYYNHFGELYKTAILTCPEPEFWTTDYQEKGRIYVEMRERVSRQAALVEKFFSTEFPVLDVGCGFGRQAMLLAKKGFSVVGADSSKIFIEIATELFEERQLPGKFLNDDLEDVSPNQFRQLILFDVLEHIKVSSRRRFITKMHSLSLPCAVVIVSIPHLKKRVTSWVNNKLRRKITQNFSYFFIREEHPYPIPTAQDMRPLLKGLFTILIFEETPATDYYVLRKL